MRVIPDILPLSLGICIGTRPAGYARTTVSQLVASRSNGVADAPGGGGATESEMRWECWRWMRSSWRVSRVIASPFHLLPLIAKKDTTPSPTKMAKPSVSHGGKGANSAFSKAMDQVKRRQERWKRKSKSSEPHLQAWWNGFQSCR